MGKRGETYPKTAPICDNACIEANLLLHIHVYMHCSSEVICTWKCFVFFSVVKEEIVDDEAKLPYFNGRVVSWVCMCCIIDVIMHVRTEENFSQSCVTRYFIVPWHNNAICMVHVPVWTCPSVSHVYIWNYLLDSFQLQRSWLTGFFLLKRKPVTCDIYRPTHVTNTISGWCGPRKTISSNFIHFVGLAKIWRTGRQMWYWEGNKVFAYSAIN